MTRLRSIWPTALRLLIGGLLLFWILHSIFLHEAQLSWGDQDPAWSNLTYWQQGRIAWTQGPAQLLAVIADLHPVGFGVSLLFMGATIFIGVVRWRMILSVHGLDLPFSRVTEISLVAQFFNAFLLGSTGGDVMKAYYAARETHHKKTEAVTTVFVDRILGLFCMLLFAGMMMPVNWSLLSGHRVTATLSGLILIMLSCAGLVVLISLWGGLSRRIPRARAWLRRLPKGDVMDRALEACRVVGRHPQIVVRVFVLSMALNLACVLQIWALALGLGLTIGIVPLLAIIPMIICVSALPITPSGLGIRENLYVLTLAAPILPVAESRALSLSLLAYAGFLIWSLAGGIVYLFYRDRLRLDQIR